MPADPPPEKPTIEMTREEWYAWQARMHPVPEAPPPPVRKMASLTAYRQVVHVFSWAVYRMSIADPEGVEAFLPPDAPDADLGAHARAALDASRFIAPGDPDWERVMMGPFTDATARAWDRRIMAAAGVKTVKALRTGARSVSLTERDGTVTVEPKEQHGAGAWRPLRALSLALPAAAPPEELGAAVREGLARGR